MPLIALEFENDRTLVVSTRESGQRLQVQSALHLDCQGQDDQTRAQSLKHDLHRLGLNRGQAIVVVSRSDVEIRELNLPPAPDEELPDMVRLLARQEFATLNENWKLDFIPLTRDANLPRRVLAAGMSPQKFDQIVKTVESTGLKLKHVVLRPFESTGLLRAELLQSKNSLVVDLNGNQVDMAVIVDGTLVAARSVRVSTDSTDARSKTLLSEVRRTAASASLSMGNRNIDELLVIGNTDADQQLVDSLQAELELEVKLVKPFDLVDCGSRFTLPDHPSRYSALLGSLSRSLAEEKHPIDFLNPRQPPVKQDPRKKILAYAGVAAAIFLLATLACLYMLRTQAVEIAELNDRLKTATERNLGTPDRPGVKQITGKADVIDQWKFADPNWLEELYLLSGLLDSPDDSIIDVMDIRADRGLASIDLKGRMADQKQSELLNALQDRPFRVTASRWDAGDTESDATYQVPFDFKLRRETDRQMLLSQVDEWVEKFFKPPTKTDTPGDKTDLQQPNSVPESDSNLDAS